MGSNPVRTHFFHNMPINQHSVSSDLKFFFSSMLRRASKGQHRRVHLWECFTIVGFSQQYISFLSIFSVQYSFYTAAAFIHFFFTRKAVTQGISQYILQNAFNELFLKHQYFLDFSQQVSKKYEFLLALLQVFLRAIHSRNRSEVLSKFHQNFPGTLQKKPPKASPRVLWVILPGLRLEISRSHYKKVTYFLFWANDLKQNSKNLKAAYHS